MAGFEREAKGPGARTAGAPRELEQEIVEAKRAAGELVRRIALWSADFPNAGAATSAAAAVGGGNDLY